MAPTGNAGAPIAAWPGAATWPVHSRAGRASATATPPVGWTPRRISGTSLSQPTAMTATKIIVAKMNSARPVWDNPRASWDKVRQCGEIPWPCCKASSQFLRTYDSQQPRGGHRVFRFSSNPPSLLPQRESGAHLDPYSQSRRNGNPNPFSPSNPVGVCRNVPVGTSTCPPGAS